jgi:hypothetical protein
VQNHSLRKETKQLINFQCFAISLPFDFYENKRRSQASVVQTLQRAKKSFPSPYFFSKNQQSGKPK